MSGPLRGDFFWLTLYIISTALVAKTSPPSWAALSLPVPLSADAEGSLGIKPSRDVNTAAYGGDGEIVLPGVLLQHAEGLRSKVRDMYRHGHRKGLKCVGVLVTTHIFGKLGSPSFPYPLTPSHPIPFTLLPPPFPLPLSLTWPALHYSEVLHPATVSGGRL